MKLRVSAAVDRIRVRGALLVFPIKNRALPLSLWSEFFPKSEMVWDWNEDADSRIGELWQLMKVLSDCREVVYSKWFQGRATFFSPELFSAMLRIHGARRDPKRDLSRNARAILEVLEDNSPLSTRDLKRAADLQGKLHEAAYTSATKELFTRLMIVGFGEVEDGAFPSAAIGATELLFGELWGAAAEMPLRDAWETVDRFLPEDPPFRKFFDRTLQSPQRAAGRDD